MSKTERRKLFQPIPLSSILDPTYQSPFSKLEQFQLDMEISSPKIQQQQQYHNQERSSLWGKLQSTLMSAVSNLVVISQPMFASGRSTMSLVPWKQYHCCELSEMSSLSESKSASAASSPRKSVPEQPVSLYHSVRTGLECLRYFATHPLKEEKLKQIHNCAAGAAAAMMFQTDLFSASSSVASSPQKLGSMNSTPRKGSSVEIFIHPSSSHMSGNFHSNVPSSPSATATSNCKMEAESKTKQPQAKTNGGGSGCILIETNWRGRGNQDDNRTSIRSVSMCSSQSSEGGVLTFSCSSSMASSPRAVPPSSAGRRRRTESESSDSHIEFSASVESTDSFCIVFEATGDLQDILDDDDEWEDDDDSDSDEDDQIYNYGGADDLDLDGVIFQADIDDESEVGAGGCDQVDFTGGGIRKRKNGKNVSFDENNLVSVIEFEDDAESRRARETYWEVFARDRARFQDQIMRTGDILEPILLADHRAKIYKQRFVEEQHVQ